MLELLLVFLIICSLFPVFSLSVVYKIFNPKGSYLVAWRYSGKEDCRHISCIKARCAADAWRKIERKATRQRGWAVDLLDIRRVGEEEF